MTSTSGTTTAVSALLQAKLQDSQPFQELALFMHERYVEYLTNCMNGSLDMMKLVDSWHEIGQKYESRIKQMQLSLTENNRELDGGNSNFGEFEKMIEKIKTRNNVSKLNGDFEKEQNHEDYGLILKRENDEDMEMNENLKIESDEDLGITENSELDILHQLFDTRATDDALNCSKNSSKSQKSSNTNPTHRTRQNPQLAKNYPSKQLPTLLKTSYDTSNNPTSNQSDQTTAQFKTTQNLDKFSPKISQFTTGHRRKVDQCPICHQLVTNKHNHMKIHSDDRPFTCDFCDMSFKYKQSMLRHLQSKHNDIRNSDRERYDRAYQGISDMRQYPTNNQKQFD